MITYLLTLFVFCAAFAALACGSMRGRPLAKRRCDGCPAHTADSEGGTAC